MTHSQSKARERSPDTKATKTAVESQANGYVLRPARSKYPDAVTTSLKTMT